MLSEFQAAKGLPSATPYPSRESSLDTENSRARASLAYINPRPHPCEQLPLDNRRKVGLNLGPGGRDEDVDSEADADPGNTGESGIQKRERCMNRRTCLVLN